MISGQAQKLSFWNGFGALRAPPSASLPESKEPAPSWWRQHSVGDEKYIEYMKYIEYIEYIHLFPDFLEKLSRSLRSYSIAIPEYLYK